MTGYKGNSSRTNVDEREIPPLQTLNDLQDLENRAVSVPFLKYFTATHITEDIKKRASEASKKYLKTEIVKLKNELENLRANNAENILPYVKRM